MIPFNGVNKRFGFGCMRLPMKNDRVDEEQVAQMVDLFLERGFNYFDTAHGYIGGQSEKAIKTCLADRYARDRFVLTDKLTGPYFERREDIRPFFESQLNACGVDRFDFYLMHAQNARVYEKFKNCAAYETAFSLKEEGLIGHVGISFHDRAEVLDRILSDYPQLEAVQLQFNYADYEDSRVQSGKCLEVCRKHGKPVIVMEPVKGGGLVNLPPFAGKLIDDLPRTGSNVSYALRFTASFPDVFMILSGMSSLAQMRENLAIMSDPVPLSETEEKVLYTVGEALRSAELIPCTGCRYCVDGCPMHIRIPDLLACANAKVILHDERQDERYSALTSDGNKASDCIRCGCCENACPQELPIRELLGKTAKLFEGC